MSAKIEIIDALKQHLERGNPEPTTLKLPLLKAYEVCGLGRNEMGSLAWELWHYGPRHLEKTGLFGLKVEIVNDRNAAIAFS